MSEYTVVNKQGVPYAVVNLLGRVFMRENLDCPFRALETILTYLRDKARIIFVDFHAEATSEKQALATHFDGRVTAVIGTHTHVQTADERILPGGTAYITDVGMAVLSIHYLAWKQSLLFNVFSHKCLLNFQLK